MKGSAYLECGMEILRMRVGQQGETIDLSFSVEELGLTAGTFYQLVAGTQLINGVEAGSEYVRFTGVMAVDGLYRLILQEANTNIQPALVKVEYSIEENTRDVATIEVSDTDTQFSYSISGTDASLFSIDGDTGALSFNVAPDYDIAGDADGDRVYEIIVTVDDKQGASNSVSSESVRIIVSNINEIPQISSMTVLELEHDESTDGIIATLTVTDDPEGDAIVYSLNRADFTIDSNGVLSLQDGGLDYESLVGGMDGTAIVEVIVTVSDDRVGSDIATQSFTVTIRDVNEAPEIRESFCCSRKSSGNNNGVKG